MECTVLAGADGATKAAGLLETDCVFLVVDCARPVFNHCLFFLVRDARHRPEGITNFAVSTLILDRIQVVGVVAGISLCIAWFVDLMHVCLKRIAFVGEVAHMGLVMLGLIAVVNNRTLCVWIIRGGCEPRDDVKRVTSMPYHFYTSVSSFRMFGHMLCYLISALVTNNAGVGFHFREFDGECHIVADCFDDSL